MSSNMGRAQRLQLHFVSVDFNVSGRWNVHLCHTYIKRCVDVTVIKVIRLFSLTLGCLPVSILLYSLSLSRPLWVSQTANTNCWKSWFVYVVSFYSHHRFSRRTIVFLLFKAKTVVFNLLCASFVSNHVSCLMNFQDVNLYNSVVAVNILSVRG